MVPGKKAILKRSYGMLTYLMIERNNRDKKSHVQEQTTWREQFILTLSSNRITVNDEVSTDRVNY